MLYAHGSASSSAVKLLSPLVGDFTVSASPTSRTITQGQSTTYTITVTSVNGFSGSVSLFALNLPGNVVLAGTGFSPGTVNVPLNGSASSTFTYVSNNTVPTGTFTVTMRGQGGGLTRDRTVSLTINAPSFTVSASPSSRTITQGQTTTYTITVTSVNGFSGSVSLFALNLPGNVVLSGTGFNPGTVNVPSGGSASSTFTYVSNNTVPTGTFTVTMQGQGGGLTRSTTVTLTINSNTPSLSSISPSSPTRSDNDQNVQVSGSNFQSGLTVTVFIPGGGSATLSGSQIQSVTSSSFTMVITLNVVGQYGIRVNNPGGAQSNTFNFNVQAATPSISSISPSSPTRRDTDQNVQVSGSNFQSGLTVTVFIPGGASATLSGSQIQSVTSSSFTMVITLNVVGQYGIRVNNPGGAQSNTFNFNVQAANPTINSISPSTPTRSDSDQNVQVSGSNFQSGLTVTVFIPGGGSATLSGSQIQSVTSSSFTMVITLNVVGQYGIRVNNPGGAQSNTFNFNVQAATPSISSISPSSPTRRDTDQNVQVSGSNFQSGLTVTVFIPGGASATLSGSQIQSVTSSSFTMVITLNVVGQYGIRVNNPGGAQSNTFNFNVQTPTSSPPTVSSISPGTPQASGTDQNVTVFGTNFQQNLTVSVTFPGGGGSSLSGTQIQNVTANSFVMRITLGAAGNWTIRVNNPDGGQSNTFNFAVQSVIQPPAIFSINPSNPFSNSSDQDITVFGNNFQPNLTVTATFPSGGSSVLSGTQIQNLTPSSFILRITLSATGNWSIRVNNPDGGQSTVFGFSVSAGTQNPSISSINPAVPITNGADQNVIVNGSNFVLGLRVDVAFPNGGVSTLQATGQIQNVASNSFLMRITLNAAGTWTIRVINPNGAQSAQFSFNVQAASPPPSNLPSSVLSPVIGPLRVTNSNQAIADGKWEFNQHKTSYHTATGGISLSNDTFAWDANLYAPASGNADAGKAVFAVADGVVVSYVGTQPGSGSGAVLIAHPNAQSPVWFSGYLHMANVRVTINQSVDISTVIGEIGRAGADNDHLHFVVYSGQNTRGNLQSFNATLLERTTSTTNPPTISSIEPSIVNQSTDGPQLITINGINFGSNSIIEGQTPTRQYFSVTTETVSGLGDAKIVSINSNTITALVNFPAEGTYEFSVLNRPLTSSAINSKEGSSSVSSSLLEKGSFAVSGSNTVIARPSGRTPVILIPGILGSRLAKYENGQVGKELWLAGILNDDDHRELANNVEDPSNYKHIPARKVVATEILRAVGTEVLRDSQYGKKPPTNVYGKLLDYLTGPGVGYTLYDVKYPTLSPCDTSRKDADLFVFPYDWRNSNFTSARDLWNYVQCIKEIRGNPSNFKVHIIAHSMGGLVARRYILSNPGTHHVERMVTLGTPWLGAPTAINIVETGNYGEVNKILNRSVLKQIAPFIRGAHELIPSRIYDDNLDNLVLGENGWNDFDFLDRQTTRYDFNRLKTVMNLRYPMERPERLGDHADTFHSQEGQDNWAPNNLFGVAYYNFVGYGVPTIGTLFATMDPSGNKNLAPNFISGDGTVPLASALRYRQDRSDLPNYSGGIKREFGFENLGHSELASDGRSFQFINCVVNVPNADACINRIQGSASAIKVRQLEEFARQPGEILNDPYYLLKVIGSYSVVIADSFGNTGDPLSTSADEGVSTVHSDVTGDNYLSATFPLDQNYRVVIKSPGSPVSILLTKSDGQNITQAIRYVDITIPPNVLALLEITPQGVTLLKYDSNGDGTFETSVNPTISVTGLPAQDVESPVVTFNETIQGGASQISLAATDAGTGVERIMYSTNGTTYQPYTSPLLLNPAQTPIVYAFADDKVANRSGVFTYSLTGTSTTPLGLALDETGQASAALDSILHTRDPFQAVSPANVLNTNADKNTRLVIFASNLQLTAGESPSSVVVNLVDSSGLGHDIPAEDVRPVPNAPLTQIIFRLPNNLPSGVTVLRVRAQTRLSGPATLRIDQ